MVLDIALGLMVLFGGVRGWFRGFTIQVIRLAALVGAAYAASPIRDQAKPYVLPYLGSVPPYLLDRLLWWGSAALTYLVATGIVGSLVKLYRKKPYGEPEPNRGDQMAGFLMAAVKSVVMASFLIGAFERNALDYARQMPGLEGQLKESTAYNWNGQYRPADRIWALAPVQEFVVHVRRNGINGPTDPAATRPAEPGAGVGIGADPAVQTAANRAPRLDLPTIEAETADLAREIESGVRQP